MEGKNPLLIQGVVYTMPRVSYCASQLSIGGGKFSLPILLGVNTSGRWVHIKFLVGHFVSPFLRSGAYPLPVVSNIQNLDNVVNIFC